MSRPAAGNGVSIRDQIVPVEAGHSFANAIRAIGADSIECAVGADGSVASVGGSLRDPASLATLKRQAASEGLRISALLLATDFSAEAAEAHVDLAVRMTHAAAELGVPVVRIDPWTPPCGLAIETIVDNFVRRARTILDQTAGTAVDLGMENHGPLFNDPRVLDHVLLELSDNRFGLTLDTGNLYWWGQTVDEVYRLIERYAPRAKHTHLKNINYPPELAASPREIGFEYKRYCCPLPDGNLDLRRIVQILRQNGYARDLCVEDESLFKVAEGERLSILKRDVRALAQCLEP